MQTGSLLVPSDCLGNARSLALTPASHFKRCQVPRAQPHRAPADPLTAAGPLAAPSELPLNGRRVLVTAPRQYAGRLISKLVQAGAQPTWWPTITVQRLQSSDQLQCLDAALVALILGTPPRPTHIAFTSVNGITGFMQRLSVQLQLLRAPLSRTDTSTHTTLGTPQAPASSSSSSSGGSNSSAPDQTGEIAAAGDSAVALDIAGAAAASEPLNALGSNSLAAAAAWLGSSGVRLCALGADGAALTALGLPVHVSPAEASTQGLVRELEARGEAAGAVVLCPVPHVTGGLTEPPVVPRFLAALEAVGATAIRVPAYDTGLSSVTMDGSQNPASVGRSWEQHLLEAGAFDAIAFSSTAEAQALCELVGLRCLFAAVDVKPTLLAAHGPYTAAGVEAALGRKVHIISKRFATFDGVVEALGEANWPSGIQ